MCFKAKQLKCVLSFRKLVLFLLPKPVALSPLQIASPASFLQKYHSLHKAHSGPQPGPIPALKPA